jgi:hypothetical protein
MASKLPWVFKHSTGDNYVLDADGEIVCDDESYYPAAVDVEDMELIVKAVNAHHTLVVTLEECEEAARVYLKALKGLHWDEVDVNVNDVIEGLTISIDKMERALAAVKGER